jgi:hypothetical protein
MEGVLTVEGGGGGYTVVSISESRYYYTREMLELC